MTAHKALDLALASLEDASSLLGAKKTKIRAVRTRDFKDRNTGEMIKVVPFAEFKKLTKDFFKKYDFDTFPYGASASGGPGVEIDADVAPGGDVIYELRATYAPMGKTPKALGRIEAEFPSAAGRSGRGGGGPAPAGPGGIYTLDDYNHYQHFLHKAHTFMKKHGSTGKSAPAPAAPAKPQPVDKAKFQAAFKKFMKVAQDIVDKDWKRRGYDHAMPPLLTAEPGRRYVKVVRTERDLDGNLGRSRSVHVFVDKMNGDVLKAASWKKPAKHARGNIFDPDNGASAVTAYGGRYLASVEAARKEKKMKTSAKLKLSAEHKRILKAYGAAPNLKALNRIIQKGLISGEEVVLAVQEALKMKRMNPRMAEAIGEALRDVFGVGDIVDVGDRPLAASAKTKKLKANWEGKLIGRDVRLTWDYHGFTLEELPQKGKKKLRRIRIRNPLGSFSRGGGNPAADGLIPENIIREQRITKNDNYDKMKAKLLQGISEVMVELGEDPKKWGYANPRDEMVHYLKVQPEGTDPITVKGKDFQMKVSWTDFSAYKYFGDSGPHDHDPSYVAYEASSPAAARKLYKMLKANPKALANVTIDEFTNWLDKNKIKYKSRHSVYR